MTSDQADRLIAAVERIGTLLEGPPLAREPERPICQHPDKFKISFGAMGDGDEEWECATARGGCGFRSPSSLRQEDGNGALHGRAVRVDPDGA